MQQLHQTDLTVRDRLRFALAFAVLECKPEKESISAFVLKLKQIHLTHINYRADQGVFTSHSGPDSVPTSQFDENQKLLSDGLCSANYQVTTLEQEVRVLKRKLMTAEIELLQKTTPLHDQSPNDVRIPDPPAKRTKRTATVSSASASPHTYASPSLLVARSGATSLEKVNSRRNGTSTSLPANEAVKHPYTSEPTSAGKEKSAVAVGVDGGTGADDRVDDLLQALATTTTVTDHGISTVDPAPRASVENLPRDVRTLQTLLLPPSSTSTSLQTEERQTALLHLALDVISQISQVLQLAFTSYSQNTRMPHPNTDTSLLQTLRAVDGNKNQTDFADPARMVGLVEKLVSGLVPDIMERLEDDGAAGHIILAITKAIIHPSVEAITRLHASHRHHTSHAESEVVKRENQMLGRLKNLLGCLSEVAARHRIEGGGEFSRQFCPFAEVIALHSTKALCAYIRNLIKQRQDIGINSTTAQQLGGGSFEDVIATLLQLAGRCFDRLPYMDPNQGAEELHGMNDEDHDAWHVKTRICDHVTKLIDDLQLEVDLPATAVLAFGNLTNTSATQDQDVTGEQALKDAGEGRGPLWMRMGMKRETMVAICSLGEQWMISEGFERPERAMIHSVYDWLEEFVHGL
ncbi:hypothetical protein QFC20_006639 [Naganishia adeliensis]|uniref:Uncharacterized protein n=1 Tax=Naganishia adeliensis TaxID=92952 RepID=A0ACC2V8V9_9TREE|nr:hypothetical protein QFC20_006639 [Naganishia adeliensis]